MASARLVLRGAASASPTELQSLQDVAMGLLLSSGLGEDAAGLLVFSATEAALQDLSHAGRSSSPFHLASPSFGGYASAAQQAPPPERDVYGLTSSERERLAKVLEAKPLHNKDFSGPLAERRFAEKVSAATDAVAFRFPRRPLTWALLAELVLGDPRVRKVSPTARPDLLAEEVRQEWAVIVAEHTAAGSHAAPAVLADLINTRLSGLLVSASERFDALRDVLRWVPRATVWWHEAVVRERRQLVSLAGPDAGLDLEHPKLLAVSLQPRRKLYEYALELIDKQPEISTDDFITALKAKEELSWTLRTKKEGDEDAEKKDKLLDGDAKGGWQRVGDKRNSNKDKKEHLVGAVSVQLDLTQFPPLTRDTHTAGHAAGASRRSRSTSPGDCSSGGASDREATTSTGSGDAPKRGRRTKRRARAGRRTSDAAGAKTPDAHRAGVARFTVDGVVAFPAPPLAARAAPLLPLPEGLVQARVQLDSGAGVSLIDRRIARRVGAAIAPSDADLRWVVAASGERAPRVAVLGVTEVDVFAEGAWRPVTAFVADLRGDVGVLLGAEHIEHVELRADPPARLVTAATGVVAHGEPQCRAAVGALAVSDGSAPHPFARGYGFSVGPPAGDDFPRTVDSPPSPADIAADPLPTLADIAELADNGSLQPAQVQVDPDSTVEIRIWPDDPASKTFRVGIDFNERNTRDFWVQVDRIRGALQRNLALPPDAFANLPPVKLYLRPGAAPLWLGSYDTNQASEGPMKTQKDKRELTGALRRVDRATFKRRKNDLKVPSFLTALQRLVHAGNLLTSRIDDAGYALGGVPLIRDIHSALASLDTVWTADIAGAYDRVRLDDGSDDPEVVRIFTDIAGELYQIVRIPMGLFLSLGLFANVADLALQGLPRLRPGDTEGVTAYVDDVVGGAAVQRDPASGKFDVSRSADLLVETIDRCTAMGLPVAAHKVVCLCRRVEAVGKRVGAGEIVLLPEHIDRAANLAFPETAKLAKSRVAVLTALTPHCPGLAQRLALFHRLAGMEGPTSSRAKDLGVDMAQLRAAWTEAVEHVKGALVLAPFRPDRRVALITDASKEGLGAALAQIDTEGKVHLLSFASRATSAAESRRTPGELEALAVRFALDKFSHFVLYRKISIFTDHRPLAVEPEADRRQLPALLRRHLDHFERNYCIEWRWAAGTSELLALPDALSRAHEVDDNLLVPEGDSGAGTEVIGALRVFGTASQSTAAPPSGGSDSRPGEQGRFNERGRWCPLPRTTTRRRAQPDAPQNAGAEALQTQTGPADVNNGDSGASQNAGAVVAGSPAIPDDAPRTGPPVQESHLNLAYTVDARGRVLLPADVPGWSGEPMAPPAHLQELVLQQLHDETHAGESALCATARERGVQFKGITVSAAAVAAACDSCAFAKSAPGGYAPTTPGAYGAGVAGEHIVIDVGETAKGAAFLGIRDVATGFGAAEPLPDKTGISVAQALMRWFAAHGVPQRLSSDWGTENTAEVCQELARLTRVAWGHSATYKPTSNGLAERWVGQIKEKLRIRTAGRVETWTQVLPGVVLGLNSTASPRSGVSPFLSFYRRVPRPYLDIDLPRGSDRADQARTARDAQRGHEGILGRAEARRADRERAAQGRTVRLFEVGDKVLVKDPARARRGVLAMPYSGPFVVTRVLGGGGSVMLSDLAGGAMPRPVDIARVKRAPAGAIPDGGTAGFFEVDRILAHRESDSGALEFHVQWKGGDLSWEPRSSFVGTKAVEAYLRGAGAAAVDDPQMPGASEIVKRSS